jgi:hypothetical protein
MKYFVMDLYLVSCALAQTAPPSWNGVELNGGASLTTQPLTETFIVGAGGVTANALVTTDSSSPANIISVSGNAVYGIAFGTVAAGGTVEVARYGQIACLVDAGGATQGDLAIAGTVNVTYCKDSGQTLPTNIPIGTRIIGQFRTAAPAGSTAMVDLTPGQFGLQTGQISLSGTLQGTFAGLNLLPSTGLNWQLAPNLPATLNVTPELDTSVVPTKLAANTFAPGLKQSVAPSATTAGLNVASGALPSVPVTGDLAVDSTGNLRWYDGSGWRLGTVADTTLTAGAPVFGNGNNHVTAGTATGTGSVVLSTTPVIVNPLISSFVNATHDHSSVANGGGLSVNAYNNGTNASSTTFLRGDGTWVTPGTTNQTIREISLEFSAGGAPLSTAMTDCRWVDYTGTIYKVTLDSDIAGSATIQVATAPYTSYAAFGSFSTYYTASPLGSETFASAYKGQDTTLTGWTTSLPTPAYVCAQLQSPSTFTVAHMVIDVHAN